MEIRLLRKLFREGLLLNAKVLPVPMQADRWMLVFDKPSGGQEEVSKTRAPDETKFYKRVIGAIEDAKDIGFKEVTIRFE